ncbi:MAG: PPOX class F420-dependent oxidoreductase [Anaerolineales bacterium]|nr:PPOX class F420-dependent oxidoreductase [Anaerolineales bacterium]MCB9128566.1 PPOX class F420-dependent oxidoreductase [Ardenticatenales bacterium]MCB9172948.1 PPOX class F420-dependent oxidoreductase [Ardenticatenales bacterium]
MPNERIPAEAEDILYAKSFAQLATIMPDGSPQVTPVWVDYDGERIWINSARGRVKDENIERDRRVAVSILDPQNPYRYLAVQGVVSEITEEGADDHIDKLAHKYQGLDHYPYRAEGEVRVIYKITPEQVVYKR